MEPKARVLSALQREPIDRIPVDLWHTPEIGADLCAHFGVDDDLDMYEALGLDKVVWVFMDYASDENERAGSQVGATTSGSRTMWGVPLKHVQAGVGHYEEFAGAPMADYETPASVDAYPYWPDPDRFLYDQAVEEARRAAERFAVIGPWVSCFEIYCQLRGLERALCDLVMNPELVETVLDRVEAIQTEMMTRFFERSADCIDLVFVSDDMAAQTGLLMSPDMWHRHLKPRVVRWCELIHSYDLTVFFHTDGAAEPLVRPLIDCPGMDIAHLKREYGRDIIFHGGIDNQSVLPFGTPEQVRAETRRCMEILGANNEGFICCSCHNVQAGTPIENVLAMVDAVRNSR